MTGPLHDPQENGARRNWLLRYLGVQAKYDHHIATALTDASEQASRQIIDLVDKNNVGNATRRFQLQQVRKSLRDTIRLLFVDLHNTIQSGQTDSAVAAMEAGFQSDRRILNRLFRNKERRSAWEDSMRQSAARNVQSMMTRILQSKRPLSERVYGTRAIATGQIDKIVNSQLALGGSPYELAKAVQSSIRPDVPGGIGYAAKRLGRTEVNNAFHAQSINDMLEKPWVNASRWHLSKVHVPHPGDLCETYAGNVFNVDEIPLKPHPQCVVGDTLIEIPGNGLIAATSRRHSGQFIEIQYSSGRNLTITPNHPILTTTGMIPATFLDKGSRVVNCSLGERKTFGTNPNPQQRPALAQDVFASFNESVDVMSSVVRAMPQDFHGDVIHGDVAIVGTNVLLGDGRMSKGIGEFLLKNSAMSLLFEFQFSSSAQLFKRLFSSSRGFISWSDDFFHSFGADSFPPQLLSFGRIPEFNSIFAKPISESQSFDRKPLGPADFTWGSPGKIEIDEILSIRRFEDVRHVYNFQTETGWYTANNTVVKNCMCYITPELDDWDTVEANIIAGLYDDYIDGNL